MSAGHTNAIPTGGGGLKVIASGTNVTSTTTMTLPSAASIVLIETYFQTSNEIDLIAFLFPGISTVNPTATLSSDGRQLTMNASSAIPVRYIALG